MEQALELEQVCPTSAIGQGRILVAEAVYPAEQMGIAAQLREAEHLREIRLEIGEEATGGDSIDMYSMGSQGGGESLDRGIQDLLEYEVGSEAWGVGAAELWLEASVVFWGG